MNRAPYRRFGNGGEGYGYGRFGGDRYGRGRDHGRGRGHDGRFHHRMPYYGGFNGLPYAYNYGAWPWSGFTLIGPGWDDWDSGDDSGDNASSTAQSYYGDNIPAPYPDYGEPAPEAYPPQQPYPQEGSALYQPQAAPGVSFSPGLHWRNRCRAPHSKPSP